jgi:catechol 2,3-dioxygenase-like lactoylglutathione lyase family enzyme
MNGRCVHHHVAEEDDMDAEVFAGVAVSDLPRAVTWFDRFLGDVESFEPDDTERVWTLTEHGHVYAKLFPEHAGHSIVTLFVSDFDAFTAAVAERGIGPESRETYDNGVRKAIYRDPDGNEVGVAGPPVDEAAPST